MEAHRNHLVTLFIHLRRITLRRDAFGLGSRPLDDWADLVIDVSRNNAGVFLNQPAGNAVERDRTRDRVHDSVQAHLGAKLLGCNPLPKESTERIGVVHENEGELRLIPLFVHQTSTHHCDHMPTRLVSGRFWIWPRGKFPALHNHDLIGGGSS